MGRFVNQGIYVHPMPAGASLAAARAAGLAAAAGAAGAGDDAAVLLDEPAAHPHPERLQIVPEAGGVPSLVALSRKQLRYNIAHEALGYRQPTLPISHADTGAPNRRGRALAYASGGVALPGGRGDTGTASRVTAAAAAPLVALASLWRWLGGTRRAVPAGELIRMLRRGNFGDRPRLQRWFGGVLDSGGWTQRFDLAIDKLGGTLPVPLLAMTRLPAPIPEPAVVPPVHVWWRRFQAQRRRSLNRLGLALVLAVYVAAARRRRLLPASRRASTRQLQARRERWLFATHHAPPLALW